MKTIKVYGASDDLVEIEGDVPGCDEYGHYSDDPAYIEFSTGDVLQVHYGPCGIWRVDHHVKTKKCKFSKEVGNPEDDDNTDTATLTGPIEWVKLWMNWPVTVDDLRELVIDSLDQLNTRKVVELSDDNTRAIYDLFEKFGWIKR